MRILADANVPREHVLALRADGNHVVYSRDVEALGPRASDDAITAYAADNELAVFTTDVKDFADRTAAVPILVARQEMSGGEVRAAVATVASAAFDPAETEPIWLSSL